MHRILEKYPKDIYEITPHFVTVTFRYATEQEDNVSVNGTVNGTVNAPLLSTLLDVPLRTIKRDLYFMRDMGLIHRVGSNKNGHWEIIEK